MNVPPSRIKSVDTRLHYTAATEQEGVSMARQLMAAFNLENVAVNVGRLGGQLLSEPEEEPGFNVLDHLTPDERLHADDFVGVNSLLDLAQTRLRRKQEDQWMQALGDGPLHPLLAVSLAVLGDPTTWLSFASVGGAPATAARVGSALSRAAKVGAVVGAETAAGEVVLQAAQERRDMADSVAAIMFGGAIGMGLGAAGAKMFDRSAEATLRAARDDLSTVIQAAEGGSAGAQKVVDLDPEDLKPAKAFGLEKFLPKLAKVGLAVPSAELLDSPFGASRRAAALLTDTGVVTEGVLKGVELPQSVNVKVRRYDEVQAGLFKILRAGHAEHRAAQGRLRREEFFEEVGRALDNGDVHPDPHVQATAQALRKNIIDPITKLAVKAGALEEAELTLKGTARSYFPRHPLPDQLIARATEFEGAVARWLVRTGQIQTLDDAMEVAREVRKQYLATPQGATPRIRLDGTEAAKRGALKERLLLIPNKEIESFLDRNAGNVLARWLRTMAAEIELHKAFGMSPDKALEDLLNKIDDEAQQAIEAAPAGKKRVALQKRADRDKELVSTVFRRVRGTDLPPVGEYVGLSNLAATARNVNVMTRLGNVLLANIGDAGRIMVAEGVARTIGFLIRDMANGFKALRLSKAEAQTYGTALEVALSQRAHALLNYSEKEIAVGDFEKVARLSAKGANWMMKAFLLAPGLDMMKGATSALATTRILQTARKVAAGKPLTKHETIKVGQAGLSPDMLKRIAAEEANWIDAGSGVKLANIEAWSDRAAADAMANAVLRDVDDTVLTPFEGDFQIWAGTRWGRLVGQFRRFTFASSNRYLLSTAQRVRAGDMVALRALFAAVSIGAMITAMRDIAATGEIRERSPRQWAVDAVDRSGIAALFYEMDNLLEPVFAQAGRPSPLGMLAGAPVSRYAGREPLERIGGPTVGAIQDILDAIPPLDGSDFTKSDLKHAMRLVPGRNAFYAAWLFNIIEEELGRGLPEKRR